MVKRIIFDKRIRISAGITSGAKIGKPVSLSRSLLEKYTELFTLPLKRLSHHRLWEMAYI